MLSCVYVIVDETSLRTRELPFAAVARGLLRAAPAALQYRAKDAEPGRSLAMLKELLVLRDELSPGTLIYMNDRPEIASDAGADGVHVGQEDLLVSVIRAEYPELRVGVSTHNQGQVEQALDDRPDYIAIGPIFPTESKAKPEPVLSLPELARLSQLVRKRKIPVVAIGGITRDRAAELSTWVDQVAVIGAPLEGAIGASIEQKILENTKALGAAMMRAR